MKVTIQTQIWMYIFFSEQFIFKTIIWGIAHKKMNMWNAIFKCHSQENSFTFESFRFFCGRDMKKVDSKVLISVHFECKSS